nr:cation diffusion facilitator family transporter [Enterobacter roggenkampii]
MAHDHAHDHDGPPHAHSHGHGHSHGIGGHHHGPTDTGDWRYAVGLIVNLVFVAVEFTAGFIADSTALMADAGHNLSDVLGLAMAGGAAWLARRAAGARRTYGYGKATVLAALGNALLLIFACGAIAFEAVRRLAEPAPVASGVIIAVAGIGFIINLGTALMFMKDQHKDLNVRGAYLHMMADAGVSLGVVIAGVVILFTGWSLIDGVVSLIIVAVIMIGTWGLLKDSVNLALDAAPNGLGRGRDPQRASGAAGGDGGARPARLGPVDHRRRPDRPPGPRPPGPGRPSGRGARVGARPLRHQPHDAAAGNGRPARLSGLLSLLSSPCNGEGDHEVVEGRAPAAPSGPSVSLAAPPIHLPISWGGEAVERLPFPPSTRHLASHDPEDTRDRPHRLPRRRQDHPVEPHPHRGPRQALRRHRQ